MSDTPITNRHVIQFGDGPAKYVYAAVAANLERENAELHKDKERLERERDEAREEAGYMREMMDTWAECDDTSFPWEKNK